jgi:DNA-binding NarL/FixJ family response regulator
VTDRPLRVLLVDDHALVRAAVATTLNRASIDVVGEAASAEAGLEEASRLEPDLVLLDIDLPGRPGASIVGELRAALPGTKVVMLTVSTRRADLVEAIAAGASGYLTKDMSPDALVRAVIGVAAGDMAMSRPATEALAREAAPPATDPGRIGDLTPREREILDLLVEGLTDRTIGERLGVSPRTVETHVSKILDRLRVPNRAAAVAAVRRDLDPGAAGGDPSR